MPISADVSGLNVQFGALDFGSEPALRDFGQQENCTASSRDPVAIPGPQNHSSLYAKPISESLGAPLSLTLAPPRPQLPLPTKDPPATPITNGFNGVRTPTALDSASSPKPDSPPLSSSLAPALVPLLRPSVPGLGPPLQSANVPPLSSTVSSGSHANSIFSSSNTVMSSSSSLSYAGVDSISSGSLAPSSVSAFLGSGGNSGGVTVTSGAHSSGGLGLSANGLATPSACRTTPLLSSSGKAPPNLSQGVPPLLPNQYIMGPGGLLPAYPQIYGYEELHMLQSRMPMSLTPFPVQDYYGIAFPGAMATLTGRDGTALANSPYSGEVMKFSRGDSSPPAPPTSLSAGHAPQPAQTQSQQPLQQQQQQQGHPGGQQAFLNPALPPGYSYPSLPYYPAVPGLHSAFQYGPTVFMPPATAKQHGVGLANASASYQQPGGYGQHSYSSGYDDLTQAQAGGDYSKGGYSSSTQTQPKSAASGPGKGVSMTSSNSGVPDISGSVYNKSQSFDKQGFHTGTPPSFSLPSALGGTGPLNPGGAPGYAPAPFLHILPPHQQPHSQLLHHHLTQDGQGSQSQRSQPSSVQLKAQAKSSYGSSPYWGN
ncbi:hypothetical protein SKAU_G00355230 [Synaphobranchus kaupii]|uniref:Ubiquitin-associated protein 2 n=1 Tax=Synaphobranchus kaupii TaxID=118154 RepID=A0A9Q1EHA8_SYNKA|nr:hypothetical protein SKAU_G00355230 [Synaphobranchus kaupii]